MQKSVEVQSDKLGMPPGTVIHVGERKMEEVTLDVIHYNGKELTETRLVGPDEFKKYLDRKHICWLNFCGVHDVNALRTIGETAELHPLVLEDIANTHQRPKVEEFPTYLFTILKMIRYSESGEGLDVEQVSLVLGKNVVLTFQEKHGDVFESVRKRLRQSKGRIREVGADYLAYALLDVIVDHYYLALETLSEQIEVLEEEVLTSPGSATIGRIHRLRREATAMRRACWPLREVVQKLLREESRLIDRTTAPYLRDLYDHVVQVIDTVEVQRETLSGYMDLYMSTVSNRMNEVMKVLTVMASIFIPLTFIAGIYGMNFEYMPELKWRWGYFAVWGAMMTTGLGMFTYFRKRGWF